MPSVVFTPSFCFTILYQHTHSNLKFSFCSFSSSNPDVIKVWYAVYGRSSDAENTFIQELQQILRKNNLSFVKISGNAEERNNAATSYASSRLPLLLFCVASTRVGTDAKAALDMYTGQCNLYQ